MPLSFGIPLGLVIFLVGVILLFKKKKAAKVVIGAGVTIAVMTFILIVLASKSQM